MPRSPEQALDHGALSHAGRDCHGRYLHWMHGHWTGTREEILQSGVWRAAALMRSTSSGFGSGALPRDVGARSHARQRHADGSASARNATHMRHHAIPAALGMLRFHENKLDDAAELFRRPAPWPGRPAIGSA
jgi:hypothetical protein